MNPLVVTPEAIYLVFTLIIVATFIGSVVLIFISICILALTFYYVRGPTLMRGNEPGDLIAPCDGVVTGLYCDIQRLTHIEIEQEWTDRHGIYMPYDGDILFVDEDTNTIEISSEIGRIDVRIDSPNVVFGHPRIFVDNGDTVGRGTVIAFVPVKATVKIILPVYQSNIMLETGQRVNAGAIIGNADQIWSL